MIQFLLWTPSASQQTNRKALVHIARLGRAAIFGYKEDDDCEHSLRVSWPRRDGWDGREEPASELHTCIRREVIKKIEDILNG